MAGAARTLATPSGPLELAPAGIDDLRAAGSYWPMELLANPGEGTFGLVFQRGEDEVHGIKLQPADMSEGDARLQHQFDRLTIAAALPAYLAHAHRGVLLPAPYLRPKADGMAEAGLAFFVGPDPESRPAVEERGNTMYDDRLGPGATRMMIDMAGAIAVARKRLVFPSPTLIGVDLRPRLALGGLSMDFLIEGANVFLITSRVEDGDPLWIETVRAGFTRLAHAPIVPMARP